MHGDDRRRESAPSKKNPSPEAPAAPPFNLQPRSRPQKMPLNTYVHIGTYRRIEWLRTQGDYAVTDLVDGAINEFLDRAGVPKNVQ
jgi:hypothetical protein